MKVPSSFIPWLPALALIAVTGCARWEKRGFDLLSATNEQPVASTTQHTSNKKRVVLDVEFVNLSASPSPSVSEDQTTPSLWQWVDETSIDPSLRREMIRNGIRVGFVNNEEAFRDQLDNNEIERDLVETFLAEASIATDLAHGSKKMPMRLGRRYELPLRQPLEGSHVAMIREHENLIGRTLKNAQYVLALTGARAEKPEQIQLKIHPEIQHGEMIQKWVSSDTALRIDSRRESWQISALNLDLLVKEGDLIVIAPTQPLHGLAKHMFSGTGSDNQREQLVLLIRVEQIPTPIEKL